MPMPGVKVCCPRRVGSHSKRWLSDAQGLSIDHIQIVQAVQKPSGEAKLIRGRDAVVRVFLRGVVGLNRQEMTNLVRQKQLLSRHPRGRTLWKWHTSQSA